MAETITIEIPVSVTDNTGSGAKSVTKNLSAIEKSFEKMKKKIRSVQSLFGHELRVGARVEDEATSVLRRIEDATEYLSGAQANVELSADDGVTQVVQAASSAVESFDGESAQAEISADDGATQIINAAENEITMFGGLSAEAAISVADEGTLIVDAARDLIAQFDGEYGVAEIAVADAATPMIQAAVSAVEMFSGMEAESEINVADNATQILSAIEDMLSRLNGSAATVSVDAVEANMGRASPFDAPDTLPAAGIAGGLKGSIASAAGVFGVGFGVTSSINTFKDFEAVMSEVKAISGATGDEFSALTEKAMQMGADTKFSAVESAEAFKYMAMAGWEPQQMMSGISGIMSLAAASGESLGTTSDIVTDALTAFGLAAGDAGHFSDVLAQASASANTNVGLLGESFKYVAPVAGAMGYSIEDTSLALGLMANAGIKGSMAGTALKTSIANLASPTKAMASAMEQYGISLTDGEGEMLSLKGVMDNLRTSLGGLSETEQTAVASAIFGKEAMSGMLAIVNASEEDYNKLTNAVYNADEAAQRMSETMMDNLAGSFEYLSGAVDEVQNTFGQRLSPYLRSAADALAEEMPGVKSKIEETMDWIDNRVSGMTASSEWANAGLLGKVNIAWDTLIANPFMEWAGNEGKHLLSRGLSNLFGDAAKIMPGGEKAGLTSWLSAGVIAKGATSAASGISKLVGALGGFGSIGGTVALAGTAAAASIGAIAVAMDNYNEHQINDSLEEHFGNVALSAKQAKEFADALINVQVRTGIETSLAEFTNAEQLRSDAEAALAANDALEWKCSVGLTLTEAEGESYIENVQTFVESRRGELESAARAASVAIETIIGGEEGVAMNKVIGSWLAADESEISGLSADLTSTVEAALTDGIIDVDEQAAIDALQGKINTILSSWSATEANTQIDLIKQKYGHLTGKDLEAGAFSEIVTSFQEARETTEVEIDALSEDFYNMINGAHGAGRLTGSEVDEWKGLWRGGVLGKRGSALANALEFETNTLQDTYGAEISKTLAGLEGNATKGIQNQMNALFAGGGEIDLAAFQDYMNTGIMGLKGTGNPALKRLYETMEPDVQAMGQLMDDYREQFGYIPKNLKQVYDEAIDVGAAAGSESAAMQKYANALLEHGSQDVVDALTNPSNPLYEGIRSTVPELGTAIDRAFAETGEAIEIDDLMARIKGLEVDDSEAKASVEDALRKFEQSISESGSQVEVTAEGVQVTIGSATVDGQSAIEQIAAAVSMSADELAQANGYGSAVEVPVGATITIPADAITFDTSAIVSAAQQASEEAKEQVESQTSETMSQPFETQAHTDVSLEQTNDADKIYGEAGAEIDSVFSAGYSTSAPVAITLDWSIVNPTANISVSGGGTGSTSVSASLHAEGGLFGSPHLGLVAEDGPEAIIPLGSKRRGRGLDLWMQAGEALGVKAYADGGMAGNIPIASSDSDSGSGKTNIIMNMSPTFNINSASDNELQSIKEKLLSLVDEVSAELAERISDVHSNAPIMI